MRNTHIPVINFGVAGPLGRGSTKRFAATRTKLPSARRFFTTAGLPDDAKAAKAAVNLNDLDDWAEFHQAELP